MPGRAIPEFRKVPAARPQSEAPSIASKNRQPDREGFACSARLCEEVRHPTSPFLAEFRLATMQNQFPTNNRCWNLRRCPHLLTFLLDDLAALEDVLVELYLTQMQQIPQNSL